MKIAPNFKYAVDYELFSGLKRVMVVRALSPEEAVEKVRVELARMPGGATILSAARPAIQAEELASAAPSFPSPPKAPE